MEPRRFIKTVENFICDQCGATVIGNGFTNHCPVCLFSKHVDINPGDRRETCEGIMVPVSVLQDSDGWIIIHECARCKARKRKRAEPNDNFEALLAVAKKATLDH